jgi:hypothetical protein
MFQYINFTYFILSFTLGLFLVYVLGEDVKVVKVYPNPDNVQTILYKDKADECFKMKAKEVDCPSIPEKIFITPFQ